MLGFCPNEAVNFLKNILHPCKRKKKVILKEKKPSAKKKQEFKAPNHSPVEQ